MNWICGRKHSNSTSCHPVISAMAFSVTPRWRPRDPGTERVGDVCDVKLHRPKSRSARSWCGWPLREFPLPHTAVSRTYFVSRFNNPLGPTRSMPCSGLSQELLQYLLLVYISRQGIYGSAHDQSSPAHNI
jgi:hypothetical protein